MLTIAHAPVDSQIGIDVQAELRMKTDLQAEKATPPVQPALIQRTPMSQHPIPRRTASGPSSGPRLLAAQKPKVPIVPMQSPHIPQMHPTPPSRTSSSETPRSPNFVFQGGMISTDSGVQAQQQQQPHPQPGFQQPLVPSKREFQSPTHAYSGMTATHPNTNMQNATVIGRLNRQDSDGKGVSFGSRPNPWPSPYQTHMEQLGKLTRPLLSLFFYERALPS